MVFYSYVHMYDFICTVKYLFQFTCLFTAAIKVVKVEVTVLPSGGHVILVMLKPANDRKIEAVDIYQLMMVNFSDPRAVVGDVDTTYIIVNDDDGKM